MMQLANKGGMFFCNLQMHSAFKLVLRFRGRPPANSKYLALQKKLTLTIVGLTLAVGTMNPFESWSKNPMINHNKTGKSLYGGRETAKADHLVDCGTRTQADDYLLPSIKRKEYENHVGG